MFHQTNEIGYTLQVLELIQERFCFKDILFSCFTDIDDEVEGMLGMSLRECEFNIEEGFFTITDCCNANFCKRIENIVSVEYEDEGDIEFCIKFKGGEELKVTLIS